MRVTALMLFPCLLAACNPEADLLKETTREPDATLRFANFRRTLYRGTGGMKWDLRAREAFIYQKDDAVERVVVYGFEFNQADGTDPLFISADRGELNQKTGTLVIEGNIVLRDKEGTIQSQRLTYNTEKKIADSKDPVTVNRKGLHTVCRAGIYFERAGDRLICRAPSGTVESLPSNQPRRPAQPSSEDIFQ
jgi:LPS export ABC transporter protein LptC